MADGSGFPQATPPAAAPTGAVGNTLTAQQIAELNAQTSAYQNQTAALQAKVDAANAANAAGPELKYNPLNDDGSLKDTFKLGNADTYTAALQAQEKANGMTSRDSAAQAAQTGIAQSKENLAMRGGIGANNSALLEAQGMKKGLENQQSASNQNAENQANIGVQGAGANLKIDQANLGTQLTAAQNVNAFNLDKYNSNMAVKASENQAKATEQAASGGK